MGEKWHLESLTIGPLTHKTDRSFWHDAFHDFPEVLHLRNLKDVTIVCRYSDPSAFSMGGWTYFNTFLRRGDIFRRSMQVDIEIEIGSTSPRLNLLRALYDELSSLRQHRRVTFNGVRELRSFLTALSFGQDH